MNLSKQGNLASSLKTVNNIRFVHKISRPKKTWWKFKYDYNILLN